MPSLRASNGRSWKPKVPACSGSPMWSNSDRWPPSSASDSAGAGETRSTIALAGGVDPVGVWSGIAVGPLGARSWLLLLLAAISAGLDSGEDLLEGGVLAGWAGRACGGGGAGGASRGRVRPLVEVEAAEVCFGQAGVA